MRTLLTFGMFFCITCGEAFEPISNFSDPQLSWFVEPPKYQISDDGVFLTMDVNGGFNATTDAWMRTYYPWANVDHRFNMSAFVADIPTRPTEAVLEVEFTVQPVTNYDQAGVIVIVDENTWVKSGIEFFVGVPHLSCVVTNNGFSDWSTQQWSFDIAATEQAQVTLKLRVTRTVPSVEQGSAIYIEQAPVGSDEWNIVRVLPVRDHGKPWKMGVMTASPSSDAALSKQGNVVFSSIRIDGNVAPCAQC